MKIFFAVIGFFTFVLFFGQNKTINQYYSQNDIRFTGTWTGFETNEGNGEIFKKWFITRLFDGTYTIKFEIFENNTIKTIFDKGYWWIENENYFEVVENTEFIDAFKFIFLNENEYKFIKLPTEDDLNPDYEFIDIKIDK